MWYNVWAQVRDIPFDASVDTQMVPMSKEFLINICGNVSCNLRWCPRLMALVKRAMRTMQIPLVYPEGVLEKYWTKSKPLPEIDHLPRMPSSRNQSWS